MAGEYACTDNFHCPNKISLTIEDKNKCIYDYKMDDEYKYQYNGECLKICPEGTEPNQNNICINNNIEKCSLKIKYHKANPLLLKSTQISEIAKRFAIEFIYTNNHISQFQFENFTVTVYKNKSCLSKLNLNSSILEHEECLI